MSKTKQYTLTDLEYTYIDTPEQMETFVADNKGISWMGFDTEFVGERRYYTLLCLIQVVTDNGMYIIDSIALENQLDGLFQMIADPAILKVTHAGDNDYRLVKQYGGVLPQNIFDTQVAAGFVGYTYPVSFRKLVEGELDVRLGKGFTVSNWESRPINDKQIKYALDDIIYLKDLWKLLVEKLEKYDRLDWAREEMKKFEDPSYYEVPPNKEALNNSTIVDLRPKNRLFLIRLYEWRRAKAESRNHSKEMVLPSKYISPIARHIGAGKAALKNHRRLPAGIMDKYMDVFLSMYETPPSPEEEAVLSLIPNKKVQKNGQETIMELLQLLMKIKCNKESLSSGLLFFGSSIKKMKVDDTYFDEGLATGWRAAFIGEHLLNWLRNRKDLDIDMRNDQFVVKMREEA